jgi:hypothetical protein
MLKSQACLQLNVSRDELLAAYRLSIWHRAVQQDTVNFASPNRVDRALAWSKNA